MILTDLQTAYASDHKPALRVREEAEGGVVFDPQSGVITRVNDDELERLQRDARENPEIVYYAIQQWSTAPLAAGCTASPNRIYLEVTSRCNLHCAFCYRNAGDPGTAEVETPAMIELIRMIARVGVHELRITGGEPTMRPDLLQLLDEALTAGLYVSLGTNGVWPAGFHDALPGRKIGRYLVSLDGTPEIHEALRGEGTFAPALKTIDVLVSAGQSVRINTILSRRGLAHLDEFLMLCGQHGVSHVALIVPRPIGRASQHAVEHALPGPGDLEAVARRIVSLEYQYGVAIEFQYNCYRNAVPGRTSDPVIQKVRACPVGREAAFLTPEGYLYACGCAVEWLTQPAWRSYIAAGQVDIRDPASLWRLWQQAPVWESFRNLQRSKAPSCFTCDYYGHGCFGSCPIHALLVYGAMNAEDPMCWVRNGG